MSNPKPSPLPPGTIVGGYHIIKKIAAGGFGVVYLAEDPEKRLVALFLRDPQGRRPFLGDVELFQNDPHWRDLLQFHEYFHGDTGQGLGASHQTGWTSLVTRLIEDFSG